MLGRSGDFEVIYGCTWMNEPNHIELLVKHNNIWICSSKRFNTENQEPYNRIVEKAYVSNMQRNARSVANRDGTTISPSQTGEYLTVSLNLASPPAYTVL